MSQVPSSNDNIDLSLHEHTCPLCGIIWECCSSAPIWDQEDTDCRWWVEVACKHCREKRTTKALKIVQLLLESAKDSKQQS